MDLGVLCALGVYFKSWCTLAYSIVRGLIHSKHALLRRGFLMAAAVQQVFSLK
jgi:hypothetical protein